MLFTKGGKKPPGSGRKPGSKNKRTLEIEKSISESGQTPLQVMIKTMRHYLSDGNLDKACAAAKDCAPYVHPRMASVEFGGQAGKPIETKDVRAIELARRIAFILGQAAREQQG